MTISQEIEKATKLATKLTIQQIKERGRYFALDLRRDVRYDAPASRRMPGPWC